MTNNDSLRSLRYILNISDQKLTEIFILSGLKIHSSVVTDFLKPEDDPNFVLCDDETMAHFLDGLIFFKRGHDPSRPRLPFDLPITNNVILKKIKVAFSLKEDDLHEIMELAKYPLNRSEMSAFFRRTDHINFRLCGDQVLRYFLNGLLLFVQRQKREKKPTN